MFSFFIVREIIMKEFVQNYFSYTGAEIRQEGDVWIVDLDEELEKVFSQKQLRLVFDPQAVTEDTELVTHGSFVLNAMYAYMQSRGNKAVSRLKEKHKPNREDIAEAVRIENGLCSDIKIKKIHTADVLFNFKISFLSDEKTEEMYHLGIDRQGVVFDAQSYYTDAVMGQDLEPLTQLGGTDLTRKDIEIYFRECLKAASAKAQNHAKSLQNDILKRLHRNITRIKGYYTAQIEELHRNQLTYEEKRLAFEREYTHKLQEEIHKHQLKIVIKLINFHVIERSDYEVTVTLVNKQTREEQEIKMIYDPFTCHLDPGLCPSCQALMETIVVTTDNAIACKRCSYHCVRCRKRFGDLPHAYTCSVCGDYLCPDCVTICSGCRKPVCEKHSDLCDVGNEMNCTECLKVCTVCGKRLCQDHTFYCTATRQPICYEHRIICRHCRRIYSTAFVENIEKNGLICPNCNHSIK